METEGRRLRIGISGSYGGMNLGDEAILEGILSQLRATLPADITVFSRNPEDTLARHKVERAVFARSLTRREMIPRDRASWISSSSAAAASCTTVTPQEYLREVFIAHELDVPVVLYAISAGPLTTQASRRAVQEALNVSPSTVITVRDRLGYRLLEDVGVTHRDPPHR